jgi:hypothetical protein
MFTSSKLKSVRDSFEPMLKAMRGGALNIMPAGVMPGAPPANVPVGPQLIETFVITLVFSVVMQLIESNFAQLKRYQDMAVDMYPMTYDSPQTFIQDPTSSYPILKPSRDERNGAEYSISLYLSVQPDNFTGEKGYKHVFHKGSSGVFPLLSPGVFFRSDNNTLRVYQNSNLAWDNHVDIPNIPLKKWFHLVVMVKGRALDVYINGNLAARKKFNDIPKMNYGAFYLFLPKLINTTTTKSDQCNASAMAAAQAAVAAYIQKQGETAQNSVTGAAASIGTGITSGTGAAGAAITGAGATKLGSGLVNLGASLSSGIGGIASDAAAQINKFQQGAAANFLSGALGNVSNASSNVTTEAERDVTGVPITINGRMNGFASRVKYFAFALSYAQIDKLLREGPNPTVYKPSGQAPLSISPKFAMGWDVATNSGPTYVPNPNALDKNLPGYQTDSWWTAGQ